MSENSIFFNLVKTELTGKKAAIHAYDTIIWKIRSGYLTIFFASWGVLIGSLVGDSSSDDYVFSLVIPIWILNLVVSIAAQTIDKNYNQRKCRVIADVDLLYETLIDIGSRVSLVGQLVSTETEELVIPTERLRSFLRISGDSGDSSFEGPGYRQALRVGRQIFLLPPLAVLFCLLVYLAPAYHFGLPPFPQPEAEPEQNSLTQ